MATILVVEDDPLLSHYVGTMLTFDGHVALTASSAERAQGHLRGETGIDLLMLDHNLGRDGVSGLGLLVALRKSARHATLPVIVCTGECRPDVLNRFLPHRIAGFIRKPFHPQRLMADVHRVLEESAARDRAQRQEAPPKLIRSRDN